MYEKGLKGLIKHWDFILLDIISLQAVFIAVFWCLHGMQNPYVIPEYRDQAMFLFTSQLVAIIFSNNYKSILRRGYLRELVKTAYYMGVIFVLMLVYLFATKQTEEASRLLLTLTAVGNVAVSWLLRTLNKRRLLRRKGSGKGYYRRSVVVFTSSAMAEETIEKLTGEGVFKDFFITAVVLLDQRHPSRQEIGGIKVVPNDEQVLERISHGWVDEVFLLQPDEMPYPRELVNAILNMGITLHYSMAALNEEDDWGKPELQKLGGYRVVTSSMRFVTLGQMIVKRTMDILGGLAGCLFTGLIYLFVAPAIQKASPGPVFFAQERVGRNGKTFKMYKFRSMYLDAEERKAALMAHNRVGGDLMFKMEDDPRIIGSEKKDADGRPRGIGNFIRNTSLDEFPQFWNVLKGDMSLVGTRPPTLDEWEKYSRDHRVRMSVKPGITGMWQVSGRSEITDFEEVVRLDREYLESWSLELDVKILFKTIQVVLKRKGAV